MHLTDNKAAKAKALAAKKASKGATVLHAVAPASKFTTQGAKGPQMSVFSKAFKKGTGQKLGKVAGAAIGGFIGGPAGAAAGAKLGDISLGGKKKRKVAAAKGIEPAPMAGAQSFEGGGALQADADKGASMMPFILAGAALVGVVLLARK